LKILNGAEQRLFDRPPRLSAAERRRIFELPAAVWSAAGEIEPLSSRVGSANTTSLMKSYAIRSAFHPKNHPEIAS
jgi:hypothetical protein